MADIDPKQQKFLDNIQRLLEQREISTHASRDRIVAHVSRERMEEIAALVPTHPDFTARVRAIAAQGGQLHVIVQPKGTPKEEYVLDLSNALHNANVKHEIRGATLIIPEAHHTQEQLASLFPAHEEYYPSIVAKARGLRSGAGEFKVDIEPLVTGTNAMHKPKQRPPFHNNSPREHFRRKK